MNKTKTIASAKSALQAFQNQAAAIRKEREDVAGQIEKLESEIKRLRDMPVSKTDFSLLLKEHIAAESKQAEQILIDVLTSEKRGQDENAAIEKPSYSNMSWHNLETHTIGKKEYGTLRENWILSSFRAARGEFLSGEFFSRGEDRTLSTLCYFVPDAVHSRIMQTIETAIGSKWGNEELPSISERRETIADLQTEIEDMLARLADLDEAISEFNEATAPAPVELDELTRLILANYK